MLGECTDYLKRCFPGLPGCPSVLGSLEKQLAIDIAHDVLPSELRPLHELKVPASQCALLGNIFHKVPRDQRIPRGPSSPVNSELPRCTSRLQPILDEEVSPRQRRLVGQIWGNSGIGWAPQPREPRSSFGFPLSGPVSLPLKGEICMKWARNSI